MRLWHIDLLPHLPRQQLLGQHRECCALRGNGWGKSHSVVNYVFQHSPLILVNYHLRVIDEMEHRGYQVDQRWKNRLYRGKNCRPWVLNPISLDLYMYPEHDETYLQECLTNLRSKGVMGEYDRETVLGC